MTLTALYNMLLEALNTIIGLLSKICTYVSAIRYPGEFFNDATIFLVENTFIHFPMTPDNMKIAHYLLRLSEFVPGVGFGEVYEIFSGIALIMSSFLIVKLWKLLPFA